LRNSR